MTKRTDQNHISQFLVDTRVNLMLRRQVQLGPKGRAWRRGPAQSAALPGHHFPAKKEPR